MQVTHDDIERRLLAGRWRVASMLSQSDDFIEAEVVDERSRTGGTVRLARRPVAPGDMTLIRRWFGQLGRLQHANLERALATGFLSLERSTFAFTIAERTRAYESDSDTSGKLENLDDGSRLGLGRALEYLRAIGVSHGDVRTANIRYGVEGEVRLGGFVSPLPPSIGRVDRKIAYPFRQLIAPREGIQRLGEEPDEGLVESATPFPICESTQACNPVQERGELLRRAQDRRDVFVWALERELAAEEEAARASDESTEVRFDRMETSGRASDYLYRVRLIDDSALAENSRCTIESTGSLQLGPDEQSEQPVTRQWEGEVVGFDEPFVLIASTTRVELEPDTPLKIRPARIDLLREFIDALEELDFSAPSSPQLLGELALAADPEVRSTAPYPALESRPSNLELSEPQEYAVRKALTEPVTYIWGPPGTGKTQALTRLTLEHLRRGNRVAIVSTTNVAVDTALTRIVGQLDAAGALDQGLAIRIGRLSGPDLATVRELVDPFGIAAARDPELVDRVIVLRDQAQSSRIAPELKEELDDAEAALQRLIERICREARVIGGTVFQTFLRPKLFEDVDVIIIDEASMVQAPYAWYAGNLARKHVVVVGDFRQLPPVIVTGESRWGELTDEERRVHEALADPFTIAGLTDQVDRGRWPVQMAALHTQFRMHEEIADTVTQLAYRDNPLTTPARIHQSSAMTIDGNNAQLVLVDTSGLRAQQAQSPGTRSRINLTHASVVRAVLMKLASSTTAYGRGSQPSVSVVAPYRSQSRLLRSALHRVGGWPSVSTSTVHRFQGQERDLMVVDLTVANPARSLGVMLGDSIDKLSGTRLLNVAISRARQSLVVVADVEFIEEHARSHDGVKRLIESMRSRAMVVDAKQLIESEATDGYLEYCSPGPDGSKVQADIEKAAASVLIFSPALRVVAIERVLPWLFDARERGIGVRICSSNLPDDSKLRAALRSLRDHGVAIDIRSEPVPSVVVIDNRVIWSGRWDVVGTKPVTGDETEMLRITHPPTATQLVRLLAMRSRGSSSGVDAELPPCSACAGIVRVGWSSGLGEHEIRCLDCGSESVLPQSKRHSELRAFKAAT